MNYLFIFDSVIEKNKLRNNFQCLAILLKISQKITYLIIFFFKFIKIIKIKFDR